MGGVDWECRVPYQPEMALALADAQQQTFRDGYYRRPTADVSDLEYYGLLSAVPGELDDLLSQFGLDPLRPLIAQVGMAGLRERLIELNNAPFLSNIEEVLALNCLDVDGTASVLDIRWVSDTPEPSTVSPFPLSDLIRLYGTDRPTLADLDENKGYYENIKRGEAISIVAYTNGQPSHILFAGYSFD